MPQLRIGISGWNYDGWRGVFYPGGLPQRRELEYATRVLSSVEINGTFYSLKSPETFQAWAEEAPDDFVYAVKGSRYITHIRRLRDVKTALANFFASGVLRLAGKLGPFLWQLPPNMPYEPEHVEAFCKLLPKDTQEAAELAREHDEKIKRCASYPTNGRHRLRHAFEPRDERFLCEEFVRALRANGHALVFADTAGRYPFAEDITAGFIYVRLHGAEQLYASGYSDSDLDRWKHRIERWSAGREMESARRITDLKSPRRKARDVYVYFDNDAWGHAPFDALRLAERLGVAKDPWRITGKDGKPLPPPPRIAGNKARRRAGE